MEETHFVFAPRKRGKNFKIISTHDVTNQNFKKAFVEIVGNDPIKKPVFVRDFDRRLEKIEDHSGVRNNFFRIHENISEEELQFLLYGKK